MPSDSAAEITNLSPENFAKLARFATRELGIKMPDAKLPMVQSRLLRRTRELGFDSVERYAEYFFNSAQASEEQIHFINAITTNKTDFFREPSHFQYLSSVVLPVFEGGRTFRVWSAGCSSGEEPYTLAMVLSEFAAATRGFDFSIFATDISTRVLDRARAAIYDESLIVPVPAPLRARYLMRSKDSGQKLVRIVPGLRQRVTFERLNFMDSEYSTGGMLDAIFFRNVMIYFDRKTQEQVIRRMCRNLRPAGYLFVGHSESLAGLDVPVNAVGPAIYRKS
ncbi:MAG TPA: CheR family methyltransferase [Verrucomicrobiae bacterium]|nr:CheR family methyltransferase [Verrucomicrobiae bacterium]